jgi:uncharacterized protein (DUF488 family)
MEKIRLYTIGFAKKGAQSFFEQLRKRKVKRVIDIRLNNTSQLAGFTKRDDLRYFLRLINGIDYIHRPEWAPTREILDNYKKKKVDWVEYERDFLALISQRKIEQALSREMLDRACLLCSEDMPDHCHRRLVAEYLQKKLGDIEIIHL